MLIEREDRNRRLQHAEDLTDGRDREVSTGSKRQVAFHALRQKLQRRGCK